MDGDPGGERKKEERCQDSLLGENRRFLGLQNEPLPLHASGFWRQRLSNLNPKTHMRA